MYMCEVCEPLLLTLVFGQQCRDDPEGSNEVQLTSSRGLSAAAVAFSGKAVAVALVLMFLSELERCLSSDALERLKLFGTFNV